MNKTEKIILKFIGKGKKSTSLIASYLRKNYYETLKTLRSLKSLKSEEKGKYVYWRKR